MVAGDPDQGTGGDPRSAAAGAECGAAAVADPICGLRGLAAAVAGRERDAEAATGLLAGEAGRRGGESGSGNRLSAAEGAELRWGDAGVCAGRATGRATEIAGRRAGLHTLYGAAGSLQSNAVSLHGAKRYMRGGADR